MQDTLQVVGSLGIAFRATGCPADRVRTFERAFGDAWGRIDDACRRAIVAYWEQDGLRGLITLEAGSRWHPYPGAAETAEDVRSIRFDYEVVFDFPDSEWLVLTIAHELAHVCLYATNDRSHLGKRPEDQAKVAGWDESREQPAHKTVERWGFDMDKYWGLIRYEKKRQGHQ